MVRAHQGPPITGHKAAGHTPQDHVACDVWLVAVQRACSSSGRASALQAEGKEFDSPQVQFSVRKLADNWASPCDR